MCNTNQYRATSMVSSPCCKIFAKRVERNSCTPRTSERRTLQAHGNNILEQNFPTETVRVFTATDLHVDYPENMAWCRALASSDQHRTDALLVAGDVSDDLLLVEEALGMLASAFNWVFYTPGNHELWLRQHDVGLQHSLQKLKLLQHICNRLNVHTSPLRIIEGVWIVPLVSWHHRSFDKEPDIPGIPCRMTIPDYTACKWPSARIGISSKKGNKDLAEWFDTLNDGAAWEALIKERQKCDVISFSHFLPRQELLPEKRFLYYPNLPKAAGSAPLGDRVQQLQPDIHVFGHTHFAWDSVVDGIRFIQAPLCSPVERQRRFMTIGFASSMKQAEEDPLTASWLPVQIYKTACTHRDISSSGVSGRCAEWGNFTHSQLGHAPGNIASSRESSGEGEVPLIDDIVHSKLSELDDISCESALKVNRLQVSQLKETCTAEIQSRSVAAACLTAKSKKPSTTFKAEHTGVEGRLNDSEQELAFLDRDGCLLAPAATNDSTTASLQTTHDTAPQTGLDGAIKLRHGWMPGPLGAHWSSYYDDHVRDPYNLTLAPWVAKIYSKSRRWKEHYQQDTDQK